MEVEVILVEDAGYYSDEFISGSTVKVTLRRGDEFASCDGIAIWEEEEADDYLFDEWTEYAKDGVEGYKYWRE